MNLFARIGRYREIAAVAVLTMVLVAGSYTPAQAVPCRFTVISTKNVGCDVVFTYTGAGQSFVVSPGSGAQYGGYCTPVFFILDCHGNDVRVDDRVGCVRNIPVAPGCCIDACITFDVQGNPVLNILPPTDPTCSCIDG